MIAEASARPSLSTPRPRLVGLIGGMGPESAALYYTRFNRLMQEKRGPHCNGRSILYSVDFSEVLAAGSVDRWDQVVDIIGHAGRSLVAAGAEIIALTSITAHRAADGASASMGRPLLHVADAVGKALADAGHRTVGLIGTLPVTAVDFDGGRFANYGTRLVAPPDRTRHELHRLIIEELTLGHCTDEARAFVSATASALHSQGCDAVLLACTELPLFIQPESFEFPVFDAVQIHCTAMVEAALAR